MVREYIPINNNQLQRIRNTIKNSLWSFINITDVNIEQMIVVSQKNNNNILHIPYVIKLLCDLNNLSGFPPYVLESSKFIRILGFHTTKSLKIKFDKQHKMRDINLVNFRLSHLLSDILPSKHKHKYVICYQRSYPDYTYLYNNKIQKEKVTKFIEFIGYVKELNNYLEVPIKYPNTTEKKETLLEAYKKEFYQQFKEL